MESNVVTVFKKMIVRTITAYDDDKNSALLLITVVILTV
jgi:hypothetical protein